MKPERIMFALNFVFSLVTLFLVIYVITLLWGQRPVVEAPEVQIPTPVVIVEQNELSPSPEATATAKPVVTVTEEVEQ